jgi:hypothetical protein
MYNKILTLRDGFMLLFYTSTPREEIRKIDPVPLGA